MTSFPLLTNQQVLLNAAFGELVWISYKTLLSFQAHKCTVQMECTYHCDDINLFVIVFDTGFHSPFSNNGMMIDCSCGLYCLVPPAFCGHIATYEQDLCFFSHCDRCTLSMCVNQWFTLTYHLVTTTSLILLLSCGSHFYYRASKYQLLDLITQSK